MSLRGFAANSRLTSFKVIPIVLCDRTLTADYADDADSAGAVSIRGICDIRGQISGLGGYLPIRTKGPSAFGTPPFRSRVTAKAFHPP
jgi:hypothetical protein